MKTPEVQRPVGFRPSEISALINGRVLEQHAEEAAFLWMMRDRAVRAPNYALKDLLRLDERVEAHLHGLRVAGPVGHELCQQNLDKEEGGEVFAAGVLAFDTGDTACRQKLLARCTVHKLARELIAAFGWLPFDNVKGTIKDLLASERPEVRCVGIAASAVHRIDPGLPLRDAIADSDPSLRARALQAVGELGCLELLPRLRSCFADSDQNICFAAAWSATRLSKNWDSLAVLRTIVESGGPYTYKALQSGIRRMDLAAAKSWQASLAKNEQNLRMAVIAAGAIGDPSLIPWIIDQMNLPHLARVAGEAFSMIAGVDLAYEDLDGDKPEGFQAGPSENPQDENVSMDPDENLPWPVPALLVKWWNRRRTTFESGRRYLRGKEISVQSLRDALVNGNQRERAAAAMEFALRDPTQPLFEVRARGQFQSLELNKWS